MTKDETEADQRTEDQNIFESQPCGKHMLAAVLFHFVLPSLSILQFFQERLS